MSMLKRLGINTAGTTKTDSPFHTWKGSPVKDWEISIRLLTIGDLSDIAHLTSAASPVEASYLNKIYILAKSITTINGQPAVTSEDLEKYNHDHNLVGNQQINLFEFKVLHIRDWTEAVINRLAYMYDTMQDEYLSTHLGSALPSELSAVPDIGSIGLKQEDIHNADESTEGTESV